MTCTPKTGQFPKRVRVCKLAITRRIVNERETVKSLSIRLRIIHIDVLLDRSCVQGDYILGVGLGNITLQKVYAQHALCERNAPERLMAVRSTDTKTRSWWIVGVNREEVLRHIETGAEGCTLLKAVLLMLRTTMDSRDQGGGGCGGNRFRII